jgi:Spy/CpxP family protein refolding chaperone
MNTRALIVGSVLAALVLVMMAPSAQAAPLPSQTSAASQDTGQPTGVVHANGLSPEQARALTAMGDQTRSAFYGEHEEFWTFTAIHITAIAGIVGLLAALIIS